MSDSLGSGFRQVYERLKLEFYREVFCAGHDRDVGLSAVEAFSLEVIDQLGRPTIGQFAEFLNISRSNATYKIANLIRLGYVRKERSGPDRREYYLVLTDKYYANAALLDDYVAALVERIRARFTPKEITELAHMLDVISTELMPLDIESGEKSVLLLLVLLGIGIFSAAYPYGAWYLERGWYYKDAEPSDAALLFNRVVGILLLAGALIWFLFL